jgi:hypothetical protein
LAGDLFKDVRCEHNPPTAIETVFLVAQVIAMFANSWTDPLGELAGPLQDTVRPGEGRWCAIAAVAALPPAWRADPSVDQHQVDLDYTGYRIHPSMDIASAWL